jgi:uncharacterized protein
VTTQNSSEPHQREERRRTLSFVAVVSAIFFSGTWLAWATWNHFWGMPIPWEWQIIPFALTATFIVSLIAGISRSNALVRLAYRVSATWLGVLNLCLFAAIGCWCIFSISKLFNLGLSGHSIALALYGLALLTSLGGFLNAAWLRVTRVTVRLLQLPAAWDGKEAVLISDLHLGNIRGASFMRRVVSKVQSLKPYAVFIAGDTFDGPKGDYDRLIAPCRDLSAPAGVYFVTGNHEEFTDRGKYIAPIERAGLRVLNNEKVTVQGLQIVGVHDSEAIEPEQFKKILHEAGIDSRQPSILLAHRPSNLSIPEAAGISLQVSGHTHKGQFWPWSWIIYKVHGPFAYGLNRFGKLLVLTSSGAGTWGPPMRVGTKSEIVLIRLERAAESA